jgi:tetratricopeptide (TPR) repeat protein
VAALCADASTDAVTRHLEALVKAEILARRAESRLPGQTEYSFRHTLLREGAYALLTDEDRALGHRLAAEWLEAQGEDDALVLAEHWGRAGESEHAGRAYARAAERAYRAGDSDGAIRHAKSGLAFDLPDEIRGALLGVLCEAYMWRSEWDSAASLIDEALRLARPGSVPWAHAATARVWLSVAQSSFDAVPAEVARLHDTDIDAEAMGLVAFALGVGVFSLNQLGKFELSSGTLDRFASVVTPVLVDDGVARGWLEFSRAHFEAIAENDPYLALGLARAAEASFLGVDHARGVPAARFVQGMSLWMLGAFEDAERTLRGATVSWDLGDFALLRDYFLGRVLADRGALEAAREEARALLSRAAQVKNPRFMGRGHGLLAHVSLRTGNLDDAEREIALAIQHTPTAMLHRQVLELKRVTLRLAQGHLRAARALAEAALDACEVRRHNRVHARLLYAESLAATGDHDAAHVALTEASAMLLADAEKIGAPALKRSFLERVPEHARLMQLVKGAFSR